MRKKSSHRTIHSQSGQWVRRASGELIAFTSSESTAAAAAACCWRFFKPSFEYALLQQEVLLPPERHV